MKKSSAFTLLLTLALLGCGGGSGNNSANNPINPQKSTSNKQGTKTEQKPALEQKPVLEKKPVPEHKIVPESKIVPENKIVPEHKPVPGHKLTPETEVTPEQKIKPELSPILSPEEQMIQQQEQLKQQNLALFKNKAWTANRHSNYQIPTDNIYRDGHTVKVGILDSDFYSFKDRFENYFKNIEIQDKLINDGGYPIDSHGAVVASVLRGEDSDKKRKNRLGIIASSIQFFDPNNYQKGNIRATLNDYEFVWNSFSANQKVKVINQSWGASSSVDSLQSMNPNIDGGRLATAIVGYDILNFYKNAVQNGGLFVWAAGNAINSKTQTETAFQPGLPRLVQELEQNWIAVVGIKTDENGIKNTHSSYKHLSYAGKSKWWSISADGWVYFNSPTSNGPLIFSGSSFAAPNVSAAAALVSEKFDWMTANQVRQTLFTTTDRNEIAAWDHNNFRRVESTPTEKYGWGMLNRKRALKGVGALINIMQYGDTSTFNANLSAGQESYFENDIWGYGRLEKTGLGTLHLTGNNSFFNDDTKLGSVVKNGTLYIHQIHAGSVQVDNAGKLVLTPKAIIGYDVDNRNLIDVDQISQDKVIARDLTNLGTVEVVGDGAIVGGDYLGNNGTLQVSSDSKLYVFGKAELNKSKLAIHSQNYVSNAGESKVILEAQDIKGNIDNVEIAGMKKASTQIADGKIVATIQRQNVSEFAQNNAESSRNVAANVEKVFATLDAKIANNQATDAELIMAANLQKLSSSAFTDASQRMSGEIYASAQALTFAQSADINRDLSNRMAAINSLNIKRGEVQAWTSGLISQGKLKRQGYASAETKVYGGQTGVDTVIGENLHLGVSVAYSKANANFNKFAGKSKSNLIGASIYAKKDFADGLYTAGRFGVASIKTDVERELIDAQAQSVKGKVSHDDIMYSAYLEFGKQTQYFTPFVGIASDFLKRGSFNEANAAWGIKAASQNYHNLNLLAGIRANYSINKTTLNSYLMHMVNLNGNRDLSFDGTFTGSDVSQTFKGIRLAKNTTWVGLGIFQEVTSNFGVYLNGDLRFEYENKYNAMLSTGLQFKF